MYLASQIYVVGTEPHDEYSVGHNEKKQIGPFFGSANERYSPFFFPSFIVNTLHFNVVHFPFKTQAGSSYDRWHSENEPRVPPPLVDTCLGVLIEII